MADAAAPTGSAPQGATIDVVFKTQWRTLSDPLAAPPGGLPLTSSSTSVVDTIGPTGSAPQGARHRRRLQTRWWMLPDTSGAPPRGPTIDVIFKLGGVCCRTRGQCHPRGLTIDDAFNLDGGCCRTHW
jgi:hypothetical protein